MIKYIFIFLMMVSSLVTNSALAYDPAVFEGCIYIGDGRPDVDGSKRIAIDVDTGDVEVEERLSGIWQPGTLQLGSNTLKLGLMVGLEAFGHHVSIVAADDDHMHFVVHTEYVPSTGMSSHDAAVLHGYGRTNRLVYQPVNTGTWTGTTLGYQLPSPTHVLAAKVYLQTDTTAATLRI